MRATATTEVKGILISAIFDPTVVEFLSYSVGDVTPGAFALPKAPEALENGLSQVDGGSTILGSWLTVIPSGGGAGDLPVPGDRRPSQGWLRNLGDQCRGEHLRRPRGCESAHSPDTQRPAEVRPVNSHEGEKPQRALHPRTGPTRLAQAVRLQSTQHGGEHRLPIQDDHGSRRRGLAGQRVEVQLCCKILNRMVLFGMPDSYKVA